jgi:hypothetical protein
MAAAGAAAAVREGSLAPLGMTAVGLIGGEKGLIFNGLDHNR